MSKINGKITNPVSVVGDVITEIESPINLNVGTDMNYQASSLSTFLNRFKDVMETIAQTTISRPLMTSSSYACKYCSYSLVIF